MSVALISIAEGSYLLENLFVDGRRVDLVAAIAIRVGIIGAIVEAYNISCVTRTQVDKTYLCR